jgi:pyruvate dehydrogenase E1 component alpha subunit
MDLANMPITLDRQKALEIYELMKLIRVFEEECSSQYMRGLISGFLHLYIGEEGVAVGSITALDQGDYIVSHYRDHGHALARKMDPNAIMAELMGKSTGVSGGRGGSMHLFDATKGFMGGYAIVGGQLPIAVGLATSLDYLSNDRVVMCFLGDGAVNEGYFHESLNLASLWKLPVIFILENNLYGMGSHIDRTHATGHNLYLSADEYNIPATQIDGMDVVAVMETVQSAVERTRSGSGPILIEANTYRFVGHSMADPGNYRNAIELDNWKKKDPLNQFIDYALSQNIFGPDDIAVIDERVKQTVQDAVEFGEQSPEPEVESMYRDIYE